MKKVLFFICIIFALNASSSEFDLDAILKDGGKSESVGSIKLNKFKKDSKKSYGKLSKEFHDKYEHEVSSGTSNKTVKSSYCFDYNIKNENDKNFCLAFANNNKSYCFSLPDREKNICLGYCFDTTLSKADKAFCLALKNNSINYCYDYNLKGYYKAMCLGRFNKNNCFTINNEKYKKICLGISLQ